MANNRKLFFTVAVIILSIFSARVTAQNAEKQISEMNGQAEEENTSKSGQVFTWDGDPNALTYEFIIQKKNAKTGDWTEVNRFKTENTQATVTLSSGVYRFRIVKYNLFNIPETGTEWQTVEIHKAYKPVISDVSPRVMYIDGKIDGLLTVSGEALLEQTLYTLTRSDGEAVNGTIAETDRKNDKAKVQFPADFFTTGEYTLKAENPGGFKTEYTGIKAQYKNPVDIDVSAGFAPVVFLYDDTVSSFYKSSFMPLAGNIHAEFIPVKNKAGYFGAAANCSVFYMYGETDDYTLRGTVVSAAADFVYQKPLSKTVLLHVYAGPAAAAFLNVYYTYPENSDSEKLSCVYPAVHAGAGVMWYVYKKMFVETAADYMQVFTRSKSMGYISPKIAVGITF